MRVVILDDQVSLREGLSRLLAEVGMEVVASCGETATFLGAVERYKPDVAIIDIRLPPTSTDEGLRAADLVRVGRPGTAVLVLSQYLEFGYALRLLDSFPGGVGYLLKDRVSQVSVLVDGIGRVAAGECVVDPSIIARLVGRLELRAPLARLSARERDVSNSWPKAGPTSPSPAGCSSARRRSRATCGENSRQVGVRPEA